MALVRLKAPLAVTAPRLVIWFLPRCRSTASAFVIVSLPGVVITPCDVSLIVPEPVRVMLLAERAPSSVRLAVSDRLKSPEVVKLVSVPIWLAPVSATGPVAVPVRVEALITPELWVIPPVTERVTLLAARSPSRVRF